MAFSLYGFIKGLLIQDETDRSKELSLEVDVASTTGKRMTVKSVHSDNRTITIPDATDTLIGKATTDVLTNKSIDADTNSITNIENADIKALAAIDATKLADGSVSNIELQYINSVTSNVQDQLNGFTNSVSDHINDISAAHAASSISNTPSGNIVATEVQAAINELDGQDSTIATDLSNHISDSTDAHSASAITNVPSGNLVATTVQAALNEIQTEVDGIVTGGGANNALSNLTAPTSLNEDLIFNKVAPLISSASGISSETLSVSSGNASTGNSGALTIGTGDANVDSGSILLYTGTAATGTQGTISFSCSEIIANSAKITNLGTPTNPTDAVTKTYVDAHINDTSAAHAASAISNVPAGTISSTNIQDAINELDSTISAGASSAYRLITATDTVTTADRILGISGASKTITLFSAISNPGKFLTFVHKGTLTQNYTITAVGAEIIDTASTYILYTTGESLTIYSDGANWIVLDHKTNTPWVNSGTLTIQGTTTNPTKSSVITQDAVRWRRIGQNAHITMNYNQSSTASTTAGSGDYVFVLPTGLTIDNSVVPADATAQGAGAPSRITNVGTFSGHVSTTVIMVGFVCVFSSTGVTANMAGIATTSSGIGTISSAQYPLTSNNLLSYHLNFIVPIVGWKA